MRNNKILTPEEADQLIKEFNLLSQLPNSYMDDKVSQRIGEIHRDLTHSRIANVKLTVLKGGKS